jgi:ABC-type dipeptide/oligopeptide/nickel transport system permease component
VTVAESLTHRRRIAAAPVARFIAWRLLSSIAVLFVVTFVVFAFMHAAPGGPEQSIGGRFATPEQLEAIRERYHLNDPLWSQYGQFVGSALQLDFGTSFSLRQSVTTAISAAAGLSISLLVFAWFASTVIGVFLGVVTARRPGGLLDRAVLGLTVVGASSPVFVTGILLAFVFGVALKWLPTLGSGTPGIDRLTHLILPAATLTILALASTSKVARVRIGQVQEDDHVTFAQARGLSSSYLLWRAVLRNAGVQIVTQASASMIALVGALIVVESVFSLDGLGTLLVSAISTRDIPMIQAITLLLAAFIVLVNLVADVICLAIDPRMRKALGDRRE